MFATSGIPLHESQMGVSVVYVRGARETTSFTARRSGETARDLALEMDITTRVFLLPATSLVIGGSAIQPRVGDKIKEGTKVFQIFPSEGGPPAVTLKVGDHDWQVHTKLVS